jgi:hypothetical protein
MTDDKIADALAVLHGQSLANMAATIALLETHPQPDMLRQALASQIAHMQLVSASSAAMHPTAARHFREQAAALLSRVAPTSSG